MAYQSDSDDDEPRGQLEISITSRGEEDFKLLPKRIFDYPFRASDDLADIPDYEINRFIDAKVYDILPRDICGIIAGYTKVDKQDYSGPSKYVSTVAGKLTKCAEAWLRDDVGQDVMVDLEDYEIARPQTCADIIYRLHLTNKDINDTEFQVLNDELIISIHVDIGMVVKYTFDLEAMYDNLSQEDGE